MKNLSCSAGRLRVVLYALLLLALVLPASSAAQTHREWRDTTLPEMRDPYRLGSGSQPRFPLGLFVYDYDNNRELDEMVPYLGSVGLDHLILNTFKSYDSYRQQDGWTRYRGLLTALENAGKRIIPLINYGGHNGIPSYLVEAARSREIVFYPFDSSQMRYWEQYENVFTEYIHDTTVINGDVANYDPDSQFPPREAVYDTGMALQTVASGIAFDYRSGQTDRWDKYRVDTGWRETSAPLNSSAIFETINYGDSYHAHRSPHFLVVHGHLFEGGTAADSDTLIRINVWYEVDRGRTYLDSSDVQQTADTNLRFLYKTIGVTRGELKPLNPTEPNWNEYREVLKRIDFEREGMGGPTADGASAQRFDLEVVYLGGEKLALRSVAVRDSIINLLMDPGASGDAYRLKIERETDTLVRYYDGSNQLRPAIYNLNIADEPPPVEFAGFRETKRLLQERFVDGTGDTLSSLNGTAIPFIQWLGDADWLVSGNYLGSVFIHHGDRFGLNVGGGSYQDVPSVKQHNGGTWHIPELFDFATVTNPDTAGTLPGRIEHMELFWNYARMGAATPGQDEGDNEHLGLWRVNGLSESARRSRLMGRPFQNYIGPISNISISYQDGAINDYDTNLTHRFERSELRTILRLGLAYGARGMTFYRLVTYPWAEKDTNTGGNHVPGHMLFNKEIGMCRDNVDDTLYNFVDLVTRDSDLGNAVVDGNGDLIYDSTGVIPGLYTGFRNLHREMQQSMPWIREVGSFMTGLCWRDAYSMHFQANNPATPHDDTLQYRQLPSTEIVTAVTSRHPVTGATDIPANTYVELGLFDTVIDTVGGTRDYWGDTNYVFVVNRRIFETGNYDTADISYSAATRALLDTLSGTREITLQFNMIDYNLENNQYQYLHIRQLFPDTIPVPLLGSPHVLDTIIGADQAATIILGAGRGALLQITRARPDESMVAGVLDRNNQRKMLYDPVEKRYYATYHRYDTTAGDYHVYTRRSLPVDTTGTILWEPFDWAVSKQMKGGDVPRTDNTHPSLTFRRLENGYFRVSVVWTAHPNDMGHTDDREILMRDLTYRSYVNGSGDTVKLMQSSGLESVGFHNGLDGSVWGTPVISSGLHGEFLAWSDSLESIVVRGRLLDTNLFFTPTWTPYDTVGKFFTDTVGQPPGKYPTLPPFTHRGLNDSTVGLAWQQGWPPYTGIFYARLQYIPPPGGPDFALGALSGGQLFLSPDANLGSNTDQFLHPSIDQAQDGLGRVTEGVTYERHYTTFFGNYITEINFHAIFYDTTSGQAFRMGNRLVYSDGSFDADPGYGYPVVSSQNQILDPADSSEIPLFSIVYMKPTGYETMSLLEARWLLGNSPQWDATPPLDYTFGGITPNGAASEGRLTDRYASLYHEPDAAVLRTTRQFFSRLRPGGYGAEGREIEVALDDSTGYGFSARIHDVWTSDARAGHARRPVAYSEPDSLFDLVDMLRTCPFSAGDSVDIGMTVHVRLMIPGAQDSRELEFRIELVDSASGAVAAVLDSGRLDADTREYRAEIERTVDLLSAVYYVRLRLLSDDLQSNRALDSGKTWSVGDICGFVDGGGAKRLRGSGDISGGLRLGVQPNPFSASTDIRFSLPERDYVTLTVYDEAGREVARLLEDKLYEAGRYAYELDAPNLAAGVYLIELRTHRNRTSRKVVVVR